MISNQEKAKIKSIEISKLDFKGVHNNTQFGIKIEIINDIKAIQENGFYGIELFARAWKGEQQLGFSKNGTVEIERFRIFNVLDNLEEVINDLAHTISLVGKNSNQIIKGKIGTTTSTFYPDADPETNTVDGDVQATYSLGSGVNFSDLRTTNGTNFRDDGISRRFVQLRSDNVSGKWREMYRSIFGFNTGPTIPSNNVITSAIFSIYGGTKYSN